MMRLIECIILLVVFSCAELLRVKGTWDTNNFFIFLSKFGFQKTNLHDRANSLGYIYGNISTNINNASNYSGNSYATLVVVDKQFFIEYYGNRSLSNKTEACQKMFQKINTIAYDSECNDVGSEDFLRHIPCPKDKLCEEEDVAERVVPGHQLTYAVQNSNQPRFWYVSLVACHRTPNVCEWRESTQDSRAAIEYDVWLVNGNPFISNRNPLEYQFSFDQQDITEMNMGFFTLYLILVPLQVYAVVRQHHHLTRLFTASLVLQMLSLFSTLIHMIKFAFDGMGIEALSVAGEVVRLFAQSLFMLLLLLIAKGWAITRPELTWKPVLFCVWLLYTFVDVLLYVWNTTEVDVVEDIDEYQTFPGWIIIIFRLIIMTWFLYELRSTMLEENDRAKLRFYLHFGAGILVWFVYLPIVALIALQVSALWRQKLLLGITSSADFLAYAIMTHLLWPTRSEQYFQLQTDSDAGEELEEFNEAPHNIPRPQKV
ncbi:transmembrane protein 145-like [Tachypleus tridentatus]|uniref:transmembrane protein 145-like n=1 Tax=Tachypleus tridentatus TaxID=6853 RepID=UPI003FD2755C